MFWAGLAHRTVVGQVARMPSQVMFRVMTKMLMTMDDGADDDG